MTDALPPSILPRFTPAEKKLLLGSADFFAIDPYRNLFIAAPEDGMAACLGNQTHPLWPGCQRIVYTNTDGWISGISPDPSQESWLLESASRMRTLFKDLHRRWPTKKMVCATFFSRASADEGCYFLVCDRVWIRGAE